MRLSELWRWFSPPDHEVDREASSPEPPVSQSLPPQPVPEPEPEPALVPILTEADYRKRLYLAGAGLVLILYAYLFSNTCEVNAVPCSLARWLWASWSHRSDASDDSHGFFVPIVAGALMVWKWRRTLHRIPMSTAGSGLPVVVLAVLMYWVGVRAANPRVVALSLVVLVFGLILYLAGWRWAKELWFACAFLLFMIPLSTVLDQPIAFPLRMFVTKLSVNVLNLFGMDVVRDGTRILSGAVPPRFVPLEVEGPCSGIRSLVALMALTSIYGYVVMDKGWKKWVLFLSSIPLAVLGNLARITSIAFVAQGFGQDLAMRLYHDYSGFIVFSLATLCMLGLGALLNLHYRELIAYWMQEEAPVAVDRQRPIR